MGYSPRVAKSRTRLSDFTFTLREAGLILVSGRSPGGGPSNPLQYSCLKKPMSRTQLEQLSVPTHTLDITSLILPLSVREHLPTPL